MKFLSSIFLFLSTLLCFYAQNSGSNIKLYSPDKVPVNHSFEIAATGRIDLEGADLCEIILVSNSRVDIEEIVFKNNNSEESLTFYSSEFEDYNGFAQLIYFEGEQLKKLKNVFEILYLIKTVGVGSLEINLQVNLFREDELIYSCSSFENDYADKYLEPVFVEFYRPQLSAGKALKIKENGQIDFDLSRLDCNNLMIEFWLLVNSETENFISLCNTELNDTLVSFSKNRYNLFSLETKNNFELSCNQFMPENAWVHITLHFNTDENILSVYGNNNILYRVNCSDVLPNNFCIANKNSGELQLDQLNFWNFENNVSLSFANKNYNSYRADSSKIIYSFNFDDPGGVFNHFALNNIIYRGLDFIRSEAPIFSKAPEINASVYTNLIIIDWFNREVPGIAGFVLEKAESNNLFQEIYEVDVFENSSNINYNFTDTRDPSGGLVCYRVKQINADSTIVYSPLIKIGQAQKQMFVLEQNYPNPFNPNTTISLQVLEPGYFEVNIYNVVGIKIESVHKGLLNSGSHQFNFDGSEQPSGIYFLEVKSPASSKVMKMILAK